MPALYCQHFIPKYIQFADQHSSTTQSQSQPQSQLKPLSLDSSEKRGGQKSVVFGTVDCVTQRELCDRQVSHSLSLLTHPQKYWEALSIPTHSIDTNTTYSQ